METSAKEGTNVNELFEELLKLETSRTLSLQPIEDSEKKKGDKKKGKCNLMQKKNIEQGAKILFEKNSELKKKTRENQLNQFHDLFFRKKIHRN